MDKQNSSQKHLGCESLLSSTQQQPKARKVDDETKESLGDWGVVVCVFLSNLIAGLDFTGFAVFYPFLVEHFEVTTAAVGWCVSIGGFSQAVVALLASYPIKSYGCRLPGFVGCLLFSIGMSFSCLAPNLTTIYVTYGIIAGLGSGVTLLSTNIIVHQRFTRNRNLASGIGWLGIGCGNIIGPILTNNLIQLYGWRGAFLVLGAIHAQKIPLCMFFRTPKRLTSQSDQNIANSSQRISCKMVLKYLKETFDFSVLRDARYFVYTIAYSLHMFCVCGYLPHTVNRAIHVGLTRDQGVIATSLVGTMATVTKVPVSFFANHPKVNSSLLFATGMFIAFLSIVTILINSTEIVGTVGSAVLFGIHMGCSATVFTIIAVDLLGVALLPKSFAILQFAAGLSKLASPPLIGWVFDVTHDYNKAFAIIGCMAFVSASLMFGLTLVTKYHRKSIEKDTEISPTQKASPYQLESQT